MTINRVATSVIMEIRMIIPLLNVASSRLLHDEVASHNLKLSTRKNVEIVNF